MAPPAKVPPRVVFKEIYVLPYRFVQIHVGAITESEVFFAAYNTDGKTNYVCPYGFFEKLPNAARGKLDDVLTGAKVNHSVSVIGFGGTVLKYDPVSPIALNELTGSAATLTTGNVAIAAQRGDKFLVRTTINNDPHRDGRDFRGFMLEFAGKPPKDLFGKLTNGTFVPLSRPIVAMQPWGTAEKVMREMFRPFTSAQQP